MHDRFIVTIVLMTVGTISFASISLDASSSHMFQWHCMLRADLQTLIMFEFMYLFSTSSASPSSGLALKAAMRPANVAVGKHPSLLPIVVACNRYSEATWIDPLNDNLSKIKGKTQELVNCSSSVPNA